MGEEEEQTPKGDDVRVDLEVTLKDLYLGHQFKVRNRAAACGDCNLSCSNWQLLTPKEGSDLSQYVLFIKVKLSSWQHVL